MVCRRNVPPSRFFERSARWLPPARREAARCSVRVGRVRVGRVCLVVLVTGAVGGSRARSGAGVPSVTA